MTSDIEDGASRVRRGTPDEVDRILVIGCIVLWLAALGASVAAIVALVDLGSSHSVSAGTPDTPWLLYSVIVVSAAVIVGAIPLLLRARQTAAAGQSRPVAQDAVGRSNNPAATSERLQPFGAPVLRRHSTPPVGSRVGFPTAAVDQIWLRCTAIVTGAMGAAVTGIGVATHLMASEYDTAAWIVYGVVAVITVAMPLAPWFFLRQLHEVLDAR